MAVSFSSHPLVHSSLLPPHHVDDEEYRRVAVVLVHIRHIANVHLQRNVDGRRRLLHSEAGVPFEEVEQPTLRQDEVAVLCIGREEVLSSGLVEILSRSSADWGRGVE